MVPLSTLLFCTLGGFAISPRFICVIQASALWQMTGGEVIPLTLMNIALALAVVVCAILVLLKVYSGIVRNLRERRRSKKRSAELSDLLSRLGITMQDGGKEMEDALEEDERENPHDR